MYIYIVAMKEIKIEQVFEGINEKKMYKITFKQVLFNILILQMYSKKAAAYKHRWHIKHCKTNVQASIFGMC